MKSTFKFFKGSVHSLFEAHFYFNHFLWFVIFCLIWKYNQFLLVLFLTFLWNYFVGQCRELLGVFSGRAKSRLLIGWFRRYHCRWGWICNFGIFSFSFEIDQFAFCVCHCQFLLKNGYFQEFSRFLLWKKLKVHKRKMVK